MMSAEETKSAKETNILVPLDGSRFAEYAVPVALGLMGELTGHLKLVSVSSNGHAAKESRISSISPEHVEPLDSELEDYLNHLGDVIERSTNAPVSRVVLAGKVPKALLEFDRLSHPDLIVMSTHGRGALSRAWLGSVADWLIRHMSTPVVLVHPEGQAECNVTEPKRVKRLLVPLDGSELAEGSLSWAERIMAASGASCILLRVANTSFPAWSPNLHRGSHDTSDYTEVSCTQSQEYLDEVKARCSENGFEVDTMVEREGPGAVGILRCADETEVDLIVMASHGRGGLKRLLLGGVADKVVRAANVPVLLVRPD
jgi:nucleotide-binding universal stress UspA family protein